MVTLTPPFFSHHPRTSRFLMRHASGVLGGCSSGAFQTGRPRRSTGPLPSRVAGGGNHDAKLSITAQVDLLRPRQHAARVGLGQVPAKLTAFHLPPAPRSSLLPLQLIHELSVHRIRPIHDGLNLGQMVSCSSLHTRDESLSLHSQHIV